MPLPLHPPWPPLLAALAVLIPPPAVRAQRGPLDPSTFLARVQELTSRGDTAQALEALEQTIRRFPGLADAHYMRGLLLARTAGAGLGDHTRRRQAQLALERALSLDRGNPTYLLEMGRLRLKMPFLRIEASRFFNRALRAARERGDTAALADVEAELGDISRRRADNAQHRRLITGGTMQFDADRALRDWRYAESFIVTQSTAVQDPGESDLRDAEDHYRAALLALPSHEGAARGLLGLLIEAGRHEEFLTVARSFARHAPGSVIAQLALGLGLARTQRDAEAAAAFDSALALMSPSERNRVDDLSLILRRADAEHYQNLPSEERRDAERMYWAANDPLRLTTVNEHRVEHLARIAFADLRYSAPELRLRGWETDRGVVYVRYGPPPVAATFPVQTEASLDPEQAGKITTVWWYPERRLRFVFYGTPGYGVARFAGDFAAYAEDARYAAPVRYDNLPVSEALDSIAVQVARFRDSSGRAEVVLFAGVPVSRMLEGIDLDRSVLETGLFVSDRLERPVLERRGEQRVSLSEERQFEEHTFEARLAPGSYRYRVEAREPSSRRAARGAASLDVASRALGLDLSDVVLADRIAPRVEPPSGRRDFFIDPNPAMSFAPGAPVHLYWEVYGLRADTAGEARYRVTMVVRLESIERRGVVARLFGNTIDAAGLSAVGDDRVTLRYQRVLPIRGLHRASEYLAVDLGGSPEGLYTIEITVQDENSGQAVSRTRPFTVSRGARR